MNIGEPIREFGRGTAPTSAALPEAPPEPTPGGVPDTDPAEQPA